MHVASNQKVVRPGLAASPKRCFASAVSPERMSECRQKVLFSASSCAILPPLFEGAPCPCIFGLTDLQNRKRKNANCDAYHRRVASFFVYHDWGTGRRSRQAPCGEAAVRVRKWTARICRKLVGDVTRGWMSHACSFRAAIKHERAHGVGRTRRNPAAAERQGRRRSRRLSTAAIAA
jgi:hypothetical protein